MNSKITLAAIDTYFALAGNFLPSVPFRWNSSEKKLQVYFPCLAAAFVCFYCIAISMYAINVAVSLVDGLLYDDDTFRITLDICYLVHSCACVAVSVSIVLKRDSHALLWTEFFELNRFMMKGPCKPEGERKWDGCEILWIFVSLLHTLPTLCTTFFLSHRTSKRFMYHRLPEDWQTPATYLIWAALEFCHCFMYNACLTCFMFEVFIFYKGLDFWTQRLRKAVGSGKIGTVAIDSLARMRILDRIANDCLSQVYWPTIIWLMIVTGSIGLYGSVMLYGKVPMHTYPVFLMCTNISIIASLVLFPTVGAVTSESEVLIGEMAVGVSGNVAKRTVRAVRPFGARVGYSYVMRKDTGLTVFDVWCNVAVNFMLMHG